MRALRRWAWPIAIVGVGLLCLQVLMPLLVILFSWTTDQIEIWQHLMSTQLPTLLKNTLILLVGVGIGVSVVGVSLAWLTSMCEFPGRRWLDWALMLPLAVPAYVLAFVSLGMLDFSSPLQLWLQQQFGFALMDVRHPLMMIAVLVSVLYPYVYMLARSAFMSQGMEMLEAARVLGAGPYLAFFRIALPMARPAIVAGVSLALMETLADFGTVSVFNFDTFTTAIYKAWFGFFNLQAAAQLASLLLLFVALALFSEKQSRRNGRYTQSMKPRQQQRIVLTGGRAMLAFSMAFGVLLLAFILPVLQLCQWLLASGLGALNWRYVDLFLHTVGLATVAMLVIVVAACFLTAVSHQYTLQKNTRSRSLQLAIGLANVGYALPGSVLAVGMVLAYGFIDRELVNPVLQQLGFESRQWLLGSLFVLIMAYLVRFLRVAYGPIDTGVARIGQSIPEAARSLGAGHWLLLSRVYWPMLRPSLMTAGLLVLVDVMKEMPATLLMRPFGWDTLAVRIYELTSEGEWQQAALPALTLVLVGLIPVILMLRGSNK